MIAGNLNTFLNRLYYIFIHYSLENIFYFDFYGELTKIDLRYISDMVLVSINIKQ